LKILLIDPPFYRLTGFYYRFFPVGLAYLSAYLKKSGHDVKIYNADININPSRMDYSRLTDYYDAYLSGLKDDANPAWQEIETIVKDYQPKVVGITAMTVKIASAYKTAAHIKKIDPNITVILGGNHPTLKPEEVMSNTTNIDGLVMGEGEISFSKLVAAIDEKKIPEHIDGVTIRIKGIPFFGAPAPLIEDLNSLPFPDRDFAIDKRYTSEDLGIMLTSRGCPYGCNYCSARNIWGKKIRFRSIANVIDEIKLLTDNYRVRHLTIKDDIFTINRQRVYEFCEALNSSGLKLTWECNSRADLVDRDTIKYMRKSGCRNIKIGVEAGDDDTLRKLNKNISIQKVQKAAKILRKSKVHWTAYFMMGLPGEKASEIENTFRFMKKIKPDFASISTYENYPGTPLFEMAKKAGLVKDEMTLAAFYNTPPNQYYLKEKGKFSDVIDKNEFKELELDMKSKFHKYNKNLFRILKRVTSRKDLYLHDFRVLIGDLKRFFSWMKSKDEEKRKNNTGSI
jgi:anaerobic magnesium-protoporphyrin IX monomethyl ester cyclase